MGEVKPMLKWAGGKRWLVPAFRKLWAAASAKRLVEPFCGGMAVTLAIRPKRALANDINKHLINFYRHVQKGLVIMIPMENEEGMYYRHRKRFNELIVAGGEESEEAASLFYYLNRTGFNGLCRFNRAGLFNVPFGRYKRIHYERDFGVYQPLFSRWEFFSMDFGNLQLEPLDFVYADPPYHNTFTGYSGNVFGEKEQESLALWLSKHSGPVVASNAATPFVRNLYKDLGFNVVILEAPRRISATGERTPALELLAWRNVVLSTDLQSILEKTVE